MPISGYGPIAPPEKLVVYRRGVGEVIKLESCSMKKRQQPLKRGEGQQRSSSGSSYGRRRGVRYGECQKNHAANIGGFAVDGCREFMASEGEGTSGALKCAACGCHRNFHRRELDDEESCECSSPSSNGK